MRKATWSNYFKWLKVWNSLFDNRLATPKHRALMFAIGEYTSQIFEEIKKNELPA